MGILGGNQKNEPLHYGEIYAIWEHLMMAKGCGPKYQMLMNHTEDQDLEQFLQTMINKVVKPEVQTFDKLLKENGIQPPPAPQEKMTVEASQIPSGAKMSDQEIAHCVSNDIAKALMSASKIIGISTREDIAQTFLKHHADVAMHGGQLLKMMKSKGWLVVPPVHTEVPEMAGV